MGMNFLISVPRSLKTQLNSKINKKVENNFELV